MPSSRPMVPRVLVLEPYPDLRMEIAATLRREHYACDVVSTAADAALQLDQRTYAWVVVDLDTLDSSKLLAGIDPTSHVVLLTGDEQSESGHAALRKPFGRDELIARLTY
jgi:DNA-binding response OmpR family regulator